MFCAPCHAPSLQRKWSRRSNAVLLCGSKKDPELRDYTWQSGYGIFSIGFSQMGVVRDYIAGQEAHHRQVSFQDELRKFLRRYEIEGDEWYRWD